MKNSKVYLLVDPSQKKERERRGGGVVLPSGAAQTGLHQRWEGDV